MQGLRGGQETAARTERQEHAARAADGAIAVSGLPPKTIKRWVAARKADVVAASEGGRLSEFEALARYNISREEFSAWQRAYRREGVAGPRIKSCLQMRAADGA